MAVLEAAELKGLIEAMHACQRCSTCMHSVRAISPGDLIKKVYIFIYLLIVRAHAVATRTCDPNISWMEIPTKRFSTILIFLV